MIFPTVTGLPLRCFVGQLKRFLGQTAASARRKKHACKPLASGLVPIALVVVGLVGAAAGAAGGAAAKLSSTALRRAEAEAAVG